MTSVSVKISVECANGELWSMNGQFDVKKTVIIGQSGLPGKSAKRPAVRGAADRKGEKKTA